MKLFPCFIFISSVVFVFSIEDFDEIYAYLPLLDKIAAPPSCPMNELFTICKSQCSDCVNRGRCISTLCERGCDCAPHFYRLRPDGPCEPVANCPRPECGENEEFRSCGRICERCTTIECHVIDCGYKCYCKEGFLRNEDEICIPQEECPKRERCFRHEQWAESGPANEFCLKGASDNITEEIKNEAQCYCKEGYKRNALGHCVNEEFCSIRCFGGEIYYDCIPKCNTTCRNNGNPNCIEDDNCYPGCFCPSGFVMNDFRSCIPVENCSLDIEQVKLMDYSDDEDESSNSDTSLQSTTQATIMASDSTEGIVDKDTSERVPLTTPDIIPTEATSFDTVAPTEEIKDSLEKSVIDDNNTTK